MPPSTSSRAGTRATQTSPLLKKPARPVGSPFGLRRSCSNSEISNGVASFIGCHQTMPKAGGAVTRENSVVIVVVPDDPGAVLEQIPDNRHIQHQQNGDADFLVRKIVRMILGIWSVLAHQFKNFNGDEKRRFGNDQPDRPTDTDRKSTRLYSSHLVISYAVF